MKIFYILYTVSISIKQILIDFKLFYIKKTYVKNFQIYSEKLFPNKEIEWKCIYPMPRRVTIDTNLRIFQYKILNNVL